MTTPQILLVDDEENIVFSLRFLLERAGFEVTTTGEGLDAEQIARSSMPDVIVLDIMLPNKSGFDILSGLRSHALTKNIPVLVLSARAQEKDRDQALALGANEFITKPFSNSEVIEAIKTLLMQKS